MKKYRRHRLIPFIMAISMLVLLGSTIVNKSWAKNASSASGTMSINNKNQIKNRDTITPKKNKEEQEVRVVGKITRIGVKDIVIDDTWFKLPETKPISQFKIGDFVEVIADSEYNLLQLRHRTEEGG